MNKKADNSHADQEIYDDIMASSSTRSSIEMLKQISNEDTLSSIACSVQDVRIRQAAVQHIQNENILCKLTENSCGKLTGIAAIDKISNRTILKRISQHASNKKVRAYSVEKLRCYAEQEASSSPQESQDTRMEALCKLTRKLSVSWNWDYAREKMQVIKQDIDECDPEKTHCLRGDFEKYHNLLLQRYEQFVVRQEEAKQVCAIRQEKLELLKGICNEIEEMVLAEKLENSQRFRDCQCTWKQEYTGGERIEELEYRYATACRKYQEKISFLEDQENKKKKLEEVCEAIEQIIAEERWNSDDKLKEKKQIGNNLLHTVDAEDIKSRFEKALTFYAEKKATIRKEQALEYNNLLETVQSLYATLETIATAENFMSPQVKEIQGTWQEICKKDVLKKEDFLLWNSKFKHLLQKIYHRQKDIREQQQWEQWANLNLKESLCVKLQNLEQEEDMFKVSRELKQIRESWEEIGFVPRDKVGFIYQRYKTQYDKIQQRCHAFFLQLDQERKENLTKKEEICEEMEEILSYPSSNSSKTYQELQREWRHIGPVPAGKQEELLQRYRRISNNYNQKLQKETKEILEKKEALCKEIEILSSCKDDLFDIEKLRDYDEEWRILGAILENKKDQELWERFRTYSQKCHDIIEEKKPFYLIEKEKCISNIEVISTTLMDSQDTIPTKEIFSLANQVKDIQRKWYRIGPVTKEKEKEIRDTFQRTCDNFFHFNKDILSKRKDASHHSLTIKKTLLEKMKSLVTQEENNQEKNITQQIYDIKDQWQEIGYIALPEGSKIEGEFRNICHAFFQEKREQENKKDQEVKQDLKAKEELCIRIELLANKKPSPSSAKKNPHLSLSEELQLAFESNFAVASKNQQNSRKNSLEEARKIQKLWQQIPVNKYDRKLALRFKKACDVFYSQQKKRAFNSR